MKPKILVCYQIPRECLLYLENNFEVIYPEKTGFSKLEIIELIADCEGVITTFTQPFDHEMITAGKKLKIIANYGVGYNNIDINFAKQKGITVTNTPDPVVAPTADLTMGLLLALTRRIAELDHKLRSHKLEGWGLMDNLGFSLQNKVLGIIGMGNIGKAVAKRANAFGMKVIYNNRNRINADLERELNVTYASFVNLIGASDFISIHTPLTAETTNLISIGELMLMQNSAMIINTSRGKVIDEEALVYALQFGEISGAALDVFANEPEIHPELLKLPNTVVVPHIGTGTLEARVEIGLQAADNILAFFSGKKVPNRVA